MWVPATAANTLQQIRNDGGRTISMRTTWRMLQEFPPLRKVHVGDL